MKSRRNVKRQRLPTLSLEQAAAAAGVAVSTVHRWCDVEGLASRRAGRKRLVQVKALIHFLAHREGAGSSERQRLAKEQADRVALENEQKRGELVKVEHVRHLMLESVRHLAIELDGAAGRMASQLVGIQEAGVLRMFILDEHRAIRAAFADRLGKLSPPPEPK